MKQRFSLCRRPLISRVDSIGATEARFAQGTLEPINSSQSRLPAAMQRRVSIRPCPLSSVACRETSFPLRMARRLQRQEKIPQSFGQLRLIVLHRQNIVASPFDDLGRNRGLAAHSIEADPTAFERQRGKSLLDRHDLVRLLIAASLPKGQAASGSMDRPPMPRPQAASGARRAAERLAIDGDHALIHRRTQRAPPHPCLQGFPAPAARWIQTRDGSYRDRASRSPAANRPATPPHATTPVPDIVPALGARPHRAKRHRHNVQQIVRRCPFTRLSGK